MSAPIPFRLGDRIELRRPHPCGGRTWDVDRLGADLGLYSVTFNNNLNFGAGAGACLDVGTVFNGSNDLVVVGGNWCKWCRALDSLMVVNAELKGEIAAHYELVHLNWSKENKNAEAMAHLGNPEALGFPSFVVLSPKLKILHTQDSGSFENPDRNKPGHDPAKLLAFLKQWDGSK